jgi:hypothetical protein
MNPNDLRERVREQIVTYLDLPLWEHAKEIERAEVESMQSFHRAWKKQIQTSNLLPKTDSGDLS